MSSKYIVRQPIKDQVNKIIGYGIQYHRGDQAFGDNGKNIGENGFAAVDTIYDFLTVNTDKLLHDSLNFMTLTTTPLVKKMPHLFDKGKLVIQIDDSVIIHPLTMHMVQQYAKESYQVAVDEFQFAPRYLGILDQIGHIRLSIQTMPELALKNIIDIAHSMKKQCVVMGIDRKETYQKAIKLGMDALGGPYAAEKLTIQIHSNEYLQSNFLRLMVAMTRDESNMEEIEQIVSVGATLTYGLLRVADSCYYALRHRVTSVHQTIVIMGLSELRQWIYLLSASNAKNQMEEGAEKFLRMSFIQANFYNKLMNYTKDMPVSKLNAYLMRMLSTLNYLTDAPLAEILRPIPLYTEAKEALLQHTGRTGMLYDLALSYEHAGWEKTSGLVGELGIPANLLTSLYFTCMEEVSRV